MANSGIWNLTSTADINDGSFSVNGTVYNPIHVHNSARLQGDGQVLAKVTVDAGGIVSAHFADTGLGPSSVSTPSQAGRDLYAIRIHLSANPPTQVTVEWGEGADFHNGNVALIAATLAPDP